MSELQAFLNTPATNAATSTLTLSVSLDEVPATNFSFSMTNDTAEMQAILKRLMNTLARHREKMEKRERKGLKESAETSSTLFRKKRSRRKKTKEVNAPEPSASYSLDQVMRTQREMSIFEEVPYFFTTLKQKILCSGR
jgi:hypothetical protein